MYCVSKGPPFLAILLLLFVFSVIDLPCGTRTSILVLKLVCIVSVVELSYPLNFTLQKL